MADTILKPVGPVRIKRNHPWASKVTGAWLFNDYGFRNVADPNGAPGNLITNGGNPQLTPAADGMALTGNYGRIDTGYSATRLGINGTRKRTILIDYQHINGGSGGVLMSLGGTEWHGAEFAIARINYSKATFWGYYNDAQFEITPGNVDHRVQLAVTYDGTNIAWRAVCTGSDGVNKYTGSTALSVNTTDSNKLSLMRGNFDHQDAFMDQMYSLVIVSDVVLTNAEIDQHFSNRYEIYEPISRGPRTYALKPSSTAPVQGATYTAAMSEILAPVDVCTNQWFTSAQASEILTTAEAQSNAVSGVSLIFETNTPVEGSSSALTTVGAVSDPLVPADSLLYTANNSAATNETVAPVESGATTLSAFASALELVLPAEGTNGTRTTSSAQSETVTLTETEDAFVQALSAVSESVPVTDAHSVGSGASIASMSETVAVSESVSNQGTFNVTSTDALTVTDSLSSTAQLLATWIDSAGLTDQAYSAGLATRSSTSESVVITDTTPALQMAVAQSSESLTVAELLSGFLLGTVGPVTLTPDQIPEGRWIKFDGDIRIIAFEGTGRVIAFDGDVRTVVFEGTNRIVSF